MVGSWGAQELAGLDPTYAEQFEGAIPCQPEFVTNMSYLRYGDPEDFPCDIYCGGQGFFTVPYMHRSGNYYVGMVRVKLLKDSLTFEGGGIAGFVMSGTLTSISDQSQVNRLSSEISKTGFVTRKNLHELYPECTFFPFWDQNETTPTPLIPFWYVKRPDGSRFILDSWGREYLRDAQSGILYLKGHQAQQGLAPDKISLSQNYPNPFNPATQINFTVPQFSTVKVEVFNVLGQKIKTLISGEYQADEYRVIWDGTNQEGQKVSSGIYLYRLQIGSQTESRKMILAK